MGSDSRTAFRKPSQKSGARRRMLYEDRSARISILAGRHPPRPDTLKQTDLSALSIKPLANGAGHTFFEQSVFEGEIGHDLLQRLRFAAEILHLVEGRGARRVAGESPLAGLQELFRPAIVHRRADALAPTEFGDALLPAQPFQYDADLLLGRKVSARRAPNLPDRVSRRLLFRPGFLSHLRSLRLR